MVVTFGTVEVFVYEDRKGHWQLDRMYRRIQVMNDKLGVVFEKSHKLQFHKRIQYVNNTIGYVFTKSHRHRMQLYIDKCNRVLSIG